MQCPKCGSANVSTNVVAAGAKTKKHGVGLGGHMNNTARTLTACCTFGLSNLFWKKSKGTSKTVMRNDVMAVCQDCGKSWKVG